MLYLRRTGKGSVYGIGVCFLATWYSVIWLEVVVFGDSVLPAQRPGKQIVNGNYLWEMRFLGL